MTSVAVGRRILDEGDEEKRARSLVFEKYSARSADNLISWARLRVASRRRPRRRPTSELSRRTNGDLALLELRGFLSADLSADHDVTPTYERRREQSGGGRIDGLTCTNANEAQREQTTEEVSRQTHNPKVRC